MLNITKLILYICNKLKLNNKYLNNSCLSILSAVTTLAYNIKTNQVLVIILFKHTSEKMS